MSGLSLLVAFGASAALAADGDLDATFGTQGFVRPPLDGAEFAAAVARSDGRLVVCGMRRPSPVDYDHLLVAQFLADGSADLSFGANGFVELDPTSYREACTGIIVAPNGGIVLSGYAWYIDSFNGINFNEKIALRLDAHGAPDAAFGDGGLATYGPGYAMSIAPARDGAFVMGGYACSGGGCVMDVVRALADGARDTAFADGGIARIPFAGGTTIDYGRAVAIDASGRIVVAGSTDFFGDVRIAAARVLANGSLDPDFGVAGRIQGPLGTKGFAMHLQRDGAVVIGGYFAAIADALVARFDAGGIPDAAFGAGGIANITLANTRLGANSLAIEDDGRIVVSGYVIAPDYADLGFVARLDIAGQLDPAFGTTGIVLIDAADDAQPEQWFSGLALQSGRAVAVGVTTNGNQDRTGLIVRLDNDLIFADAY
ncbi:MAG: delta-60 repeat domain-containing protein [Dokdonella sp.]